MLSVGHGVSDHILEEDFEDSPGLLVDEAGDTLHASSTSQTANGRLGDPLDVVAKHLPVTLGSSLAQSLASLTTAGHFCRVPPFHRYWNKIPLNRSEFNVITSVDIINENLAELKFRTQTDVLGIGVTVSEQGREKEEKIIKKRLN
nr:histone H4 [Ipomoea batatas]